MSTSEFNVWCPYILRSRKVKFDLNMAGTHFISEISVGFINACLAALGIAGSPSSWRLSCVRQAYYSDYRTSDDWRARWDLAWVVNMILEQESPPQPQVLPLWPLKVDGTGYVARNDEEPQCLHSPVLLIANTRLPNSDRLPDDIVPAIMQILPGARIRVTVRRYSKPPLVQVRALLESLQFPRDVEALDAIVKELETMGTFVSWQQTVREFGT